MLIRELYLLLLLTFGSHLAFSQDKNQPLAGNYSIPFRLTNFNNISVQTVLNQRDTVRLMFHTAANAVTLTEEAVKQLKTINFAGADSVKSWGGGGNTSRYSKSNTIQLGELHWHDVPIWENKNSGLETDGKFGIDLFAHKIIELDFDKKQIRLHSGLPENVGTYEKLKLIIENEMLFVEAGCELGGRIIKNKFLLHSGYSGAVLFDDTFVKDNKIDETLTVISEKELKDSFGNVLKTKRAILPSFRVGNETLTSVPVGFFSGSIGRQKMSIIGGDLLKRFNIIIDVAGQYIYLKPNGLRDTNYFSS
ncbi:retropepsin-like aspartic protease [Spirosoma daeguense]